MIKSMTAFAGNEVTIGNLTIDCELRSVNHRFCDLSLKLPERLRFLETELRNLISTKIQRGKVDCTLTCTSHLTRAFDIVVDQAALDSLLKAIRQIEQQIEPSSQLSALDILAFPGIQQEPQEEDYEHSVSGIIALVDRTLNDLLQVREREGRQLKKLIDDRCRQMSGFITQAKVRMPIVLKQLRNRLKDRIEEAVSQPDYERLDQELVLLAQKLDVAEELDRLEAHVVEVQRVIIQSEPVGRRLDFLMQELHREANTLGSKSIDKEITQVSIELKVLIEQMREQIQNIE